MKKIKEIKTSQKHLAQIMHNNKLEDTQTFASHLLLVIIGLFTALFFLWATFTEIDEIARGKGVVIPSGQNQIVQNLEGGIVADIFVKEGDFVNKGDILIKITNLTSSSKESSALKKEAALVAKKQRLQAQAYEQDFTSQTTNEKPINQFIEDEKKLYNMQKINLNLKIGVLNDMRLKEEAQLKDIKQQIQYYKKTNQLILEEIEMIEPLVKRGIKSKLSLIKLQQEYSNAKRTLASKKISIEKANAEIAHINKKIKQAKENFKSDVREELNEVNSELAQLQSQTKALTDQVMRTIVRAPRNGIVKKLFVHTVGGAIKPTQNLVEIVPVDETLLVEVKIKPSDIAFIYHKQDAIVRFNAYDFSIYGGVNAKVIAISPDTIKEENDTYYLLRVKTEQNFIQKKGNKLKIIPGMVSDVDILTGKKSVLAYITRPLLKTMQYTFSER